MKMISTLLSACIFAPLLQFCGNKAASAPVSLENVKTMFDYSATDIDGNEVSLSAYKGKKVMIVNVASKCGYTSQYKDLQRLWETYGPDNFVILGFPSNQFMGQEPGSDSDIKAFCSANYGVTFPMFSKIEVKGKGRHPLYQWLTDKSLNGVENSEVAWNFNKYLIDEEGRYVRHLKSGVAPFDEEVVSWIKGK
jgi:glutathione peroxidase